MLHTRSLELPRQVTVMADRGGTSVIALPANTSLNIYIDSKTATRMCFELRGIQVFSLAHTLCRPGPQAFDRCSNEVVIALGQIRDMRELLNALLADEGMPVAAARLAQALVLLGRIDDAAQILTTMREAGFIVRT